MKISEKVQDALFVFFFLLAGTIGGTAAGVMVFLLLR
jgi:hypothetical protein